MLTTPVATYWAESSTLNKDIAKRLAAVKRKVLRRIYVGTEVNENWRKWYNEELTQLFGDLNIISFVRKVSWIKLVMLTNG